MSITISRTRASKDDSWGIAVSSQGRVARISPSSPFAGSLRVGSRIRNVNDDDTNSVEDITNAVKKAETSLKLVVEDSAADTTSSKLARESATQSWGLKLNKFGVVLEVEAGSPAEACGLKKDDVINEVNGEIISSATDISKALKGATNVSLGVVRVDAEKAAALEAAEKKAAEERAKLKQQEANKDSSNKDNKSGNSKSKKNKNKNNNNKQGENNNDSASSNNDKSNKSSESPKAIAGSSNNSESEAARRARIEESRRDYHSRNFKQQQGDQRRNNNNNNNKDKGNQQQQQQQRNTASAPATNTNLNNAGGVSPGALMAAADRAAERDFGGKVINAVLYQADRMDEAFNNPTFSPRAHHYETRLQLMRHAAEHFAIDRQARFDEFARRHRVSSYVHLPGAWRRFGGNAEKNLTVRSLQVPFLDVMPRPDASQFDLLRSPVFSVSAPTIKGTGAAAAGAAAVDVTATTAGQERPETMLAVWTALPFITRTAANAMMSQHTGDAIQEKMRQYRIVAAKHEESKAKDGDKGATTAGADAGSDAEAEGEASKSKPAGVEPPNLNAERKATRLVRSLGFIMSQDEGMKLLDATGGDIKVSSQRHDFRHLLRVHDDNTSRSTDTVAEVIQVDFDAAGRSNSFGEKGVFVFVLDEENSNRVDRRVSALPVANDLPSFFDPERYFAQKALCSTHAAVFHFGGLAGLVLNGGKRFVPLSVQHFKYAAMKSVFRK